MLPGVIPSTSSSILSQPGNMMSSYMSSTSGRMNESLTESVGESSKGIQKPRAGISGTIASFSTSATQLQLQAKPFRLALMKSIAIEISACKDALSIIPLLQVTLVILQELDGNSDEEVVVVEAVVKRLLEMMNLTVNIQFFNAVLSLVW
jgi:hypothetical protein